MQLVGRRALTDAAHTPMKEDRHNYMNKIKIIKGKTVYIMSLVFHVGLIKI